MVIHMHTFVVVGVVVVVVNVVFCCCICFFRYISICRIFLVPHGGLGYFDHQGKIIVVQNNDFDLEP